MVSRYNRLIQERADLIMDARALFEAAEGRDLTAEEAVQDDMINARLTTLATEIAREEAHRERLRSVQSIEVPGIAAPVPITGIRDRVQDDPMRGFRNAGDFALAVHRASMPGGILDDRLRGLYAAPTNYHQETGGTAGEGYLVPPQMREDIYTLAFAENLVSLIDWEPTQANEVELAADETTPWGSTGVKAYWRTEAAQMTATKIAYLARHVRLHELYAFVLATTELLQDAPRLADRITRQAARAINWEAGLAIVEGTGSGKPLGYLIAACKIEVAKETSQVAATVVTENIAKMYARLIPGTRSFWLINPDVMPQFMTMTIGQQPIWSPPNGLVIAPGGILMGRPIYFSDYCETVGTAGDIHLVNPEGYYAVRRSTEPEYAESMHLYFDYGVNAFRWTFRLGGQPFLSAAVSPAKGSSTRSHFVTLATRS